MRLYRTVAGRWAGTQVEAHILAREDSAGRWCQVDVPTDKPGLLGFLNAQLLGNQLAQEPPEHAAPGFATAEPMTEDAFEALPLPMQLHLAALALENARERIKP